MSGIFGMVGAGGDEAPRIARMAEALVHRGPDDLGTYVGRGAALGCQLLRTRGPAEERQPVSNEAGEIHAVLDGGIYNGAALRQELEREGRPVRAHSDAELLIRLYEQDGEGCVARMRGMFAFAIWDQRRGRLVLARDHLGEKPLFYVQGAGGFYFASEMKALLAAGLFTPEMDLESLDRYLSMRFVPGSGTILRGVKKLPPAHALVLEGGRATVSRYWRLSFADKLRLSHDAYIDSLDEKLEAAVRSQLAAEGETGAFLSGGLDSSLIVAMMARVVKEPVPTFSIGFAEKAFDEIPHARTVSQAFGTRQIETQADTDLIEALPAMIHALDEPSDPVAVSFFAAARLAGKHVKVVLGGDGGNELFAGSDRYRGVLLSSYYSKVPAFVRGALVSPLIRLIPASFGYESLGLKLRWFERMAGVGGLGETLAEAVAFFRFSREEKRALLMPGIQARVDPEATAREISDLYYESDAEDPIERMLYTDFCTRLPEHLLMLVDRMGMAQSLEIRSPLVDRELVEHLARFPLSIKVRGQQARYIERRLAERLLPLSIARRKKRGFRFPLAYWFAVKLHPFLQRVFADSSLIEDGILDKTYVLRLLDEHRRRRVDHSWKIWMLLNLEVWYRMTIRGGSLNEVQEWTHLQTRDS